MTTRLAAAPRPTPPHAGIYVVLMLNGFVAAAGLTVIYLMLATLYREYEGSSGVGWAVTTYLLVSAISAALCGRLGDLVGRRFMILVVLALAGAGSLASALAPSLAGVIAGCALQGAAGALMPLSVGLARETLPPARVPVALGVITCSGMFGAGIAWLLAGVVLDHYASHGGFILKLGLAAIAFVAVTTIVPRPTRPQGTLAGVDLLRGVLFAPGLGFGLVSLELGRKWGYGDIRVVGGFTLAAALLAYWVRFQATQARPLIDVRLLARPRIALTNLAWIFLALGPIQLGQTLSLMLQQPASTGIGFGFAPSVVGWVMLPLNTLTVFVSPAAGRLGRRIGDRRVGLLGACACLGAWLTLTLWHASFASVAVAAILCTAGYATLMPALYCLIAEATPVERASEAAGVSAVCLAAFMAVGSQLLFGLLGSDRVRDAAHGLFTFPSDRAFTAAFAYVVAMCICCIASLLAIRPRASVEEALPAGLGPAGEIS